jgi:hypothetical protein
MRPLQIAARTQRWGANAACGAAALMILLCAPRAAQAYRPFDGTDADVAHEGEFELELGPAYTLDNRRTRDLTMPGTTLNFGVADGWELTIDTRNTALMGTTLGKQGDSFDSELHLKTVVRRGCLQGAIGPSIAAEFGAMLPSADGRKDSAGSVQLIVSQVLRPITLHLNLELVRDAASQSSVFSSLIAEGPESMPVRPVVEIAAQRQIDGPASYSALAGGIWNAVEGTAVDAAFRGSVSDTDVLGAEVRIGFTWQTVMWHPRHAPVAESARAEP